MIPQRDETHFPGCYVLDVQTRPPFRSSCGTVPQHNPPGTIQQNPIETQRATYDVYKLLHLSDTFGADLAHFQGYQCTELIPL